MKNSVLDLLPTTTNFSFLKTSLGYQKVRGIYYAPCSLQSEKKHLDSSVLHGFHQPLKAILLATPENAMLALSFPNMMESIIWNVLISKYL